MADVIEFSVIQPRNDRRIGWFLLAITVKMTVSSSLLAPAARCLSQTDIYISCIHIFTYEKYRMSDQQSQTRSTHHAPLGIAVQDHAPA